MESCDNTELLPLDVSDFPWLYETSKEYSDAEDIGKWMLFFDKQMLNGSWSHAKSLYREKKFNVLS